MAKAVARKTDSLKALKNFDRKFGPEFLQGLPAQPGVYRIYDETGLLIYIGKAKNLRRRLSQYRNAKRRKKHFKMRAIVGDAARIEHEICASDLEACLLEARLIQQARPRWNVAGAFSFMYPYVGIRRDADGAGATFCFTTEPLSCPGFELHGAYRSRHAVAEAFFALTRLLSFVAHRVPRRNKRAPGGGRTYEASFRRFPPEWLPHWTAFCEGASRAAIEELVLALADNPAARHKPRKIQDDLNLIGRFWRHEALPLARARKWAGGTVPYPVAQAERDLLFLRYRYRKESGKGPRPDAPLSGYGSGS